MQVPSPSRLVTLTALNFWLTGAAIPLAVAGRSASAPQLVVALSALALGAYGLRKASSVVLLLAFPIATLLPIFSQPAAQSSRLVPRAALALVGASLVAHFAASSRWLTDRPSEATFTSAVVALPSRWRRRLRAYRIITATAPSCCRLHCLSRRSRWSTGLPSRRVRPSPAGVAHAASHHALVGDARINVRQDVVVRGALAAIAGQRGRVNLARLAATVCLLLAGLMWLLMHHGRFW